MPEDDGPGYSDLSAPKRQPRNGKSAHIVEGSPESGCNVRTQDPENFDEEVKSLVTAWRIQKTSEGSDITLTSSNNRVERNG